MPQLMEQYVETGLVRFVYRDFLVEGHKSALVAAVAGRCAGQQGQFWPMHDKLFETHQEEWGGVPNRDLPVLVELAGGLGMNSGAFSACMADPAVEQAVLQEFQTAQRLGITGTPTFIINGRVLVGAQPLEAFQQAIAEAQSELR